MKGVALRWLYGPCDFTSKPVRHCRSRVAKPVLGNGIFGSNDKTVLKHHGAWQQLLLLRPRRNLLDLLYQFSAEPDYTANNVSRLTILKDRTEWPASWLASSTKYHQSAGYLVKARTMTTTDLPCPKYGPGASSSAHPGGLYEAYAKLLQHVLRQLALSDSLPAAPGHYCLLQVLPLWNSLLSVQS